MERGRVFRVVVADGRPRGEGVEMARRLTAAGIADVQYVQVSTLPYVMPEVTKALLGAHAVLANGCVMSRVGSSQVSRKKRGPIVPCPFTLIPSPSS
jgi:translation initiation factor eIF-2B subunit delta